MPKVVWLIVAGAFIGERWGLPGVIALGVLELAGVYFGGMLEAWREDRRKD